MYDNSSGRLDDYWREVSDDAINIEGSIAIDWVVLPNPHSYYVATPGSGTSANRAALFNDVESETVDGFEITIDRGNSLVFLDGFESGDLLGWSSVESQ